MQVDQEWFLKSPAPRGSPCRSRLEYAPERIPKYNRKGKAACSSYSSMYVTVEVSSKMVKYLAMVIGAVAVIGVATVNKLVWSSLCVASQVHLLLFVGAVIPPPPLQMLMRCIFVSFEFYRR